MLRFLTSPLRRHAVNACFCTLAIHAPYRQRAKLLFADAPQLSWIVFTDEPEDFAGLPVRAIRHSPTGPMAEDFLTKLKWTASGRGRPAYHDKRFVLQATLEEFDTAIFVDADSRMSPVPKLPTFSPGIAAVKEVYASLVEHLSRYGSDRLPAFEQLAVHLTGSAEVLKSARWCSEALFAVTKDGNESKFFEAWERGAEVLHSQNVFTGEGGVIGLAALYAGWTVNYNTLNKLAASIHHEGLGPKLT
jgi:hypothetical protein